MSAPSKELISAIATYQRLIKSQIQASPAIQDVARSLEGVTQTLKESKFTLQIVSQFPALILPFQHFVTHHKMLEKLYQWEVLSLTPDWQPAIPKTIAVPKLQAIGNDALEYELEKGINTASQLIGRRSDCQVLIPDHYVLVSGVHAEIQLWSDENCAISQRHWKISDRSRNGTYVNGRRIQDHCRLEEGDRITLGLPEPTETAPELLFTVQSKVLTQNPELSELGNCDVLCLLVDAVQGLTDCEQRLVKILQQGGQNQPVLVVLPFQSEHQSWEEVQTYTQELTHLLQSYQNLCFRTIALPLCASAPGHSQQGFNEVGDHLKNLAKTTLKASISKPIRFQTLQKLEQVEKLFVLEEKYLQAKYHREIEKLNVTQQDFSKEKVALKLKQLNDAITDFFKHAKESVKQSKASLLDEYFANSITNKLKNFTARFKPVLTNHDNRKYIQLQYGGEDLDLEEMGDRPPEEILQRQADANAILLNFCCLELSTWAKNEWETLCYHHPRDGMKGLFQDISTVLSTLPHRRSSLLSEQLSPSNPSFSFQADLNEKFAKTACKGHHKEVPPVFYILKKVRSQWMQFFFIFSFVSILGIASRRQIMGLVTQPIVHGFKNSPFIAILLLGIVLYCLVRYLIKVYRADREESREEVARKLRGNLYNYYYALVKTHLSNQIFQDLVAALDAEEKRLKDILVSIREQIEKTTVAQSQAQVSTRKGLEVWEKLLQDIRQYQEDLLKLKVLL